MSTGITVKFSNEYKAALCQLIDQEFKKPLLQGKRGYGIIEDMIRRQNQPALRLNTVKMATQLQTKEPIQYWYAVISALFTLTSFTGKASDKFKEKVNKKTTSRSR